MNKAIYLLYAQLAVTYIPAAFIGYAAFGKICNHCMRLSFAPASAAAAAAAATAAANADTDTASCHMAHLPTKPFLSGTRRSSAGSDLVSGGGSFLPFYMASIPSADSPSPKWALVLINLLILWNAVCGCMVSLQLTACGHD